MFKGIKNRENLDLDLVFNAESEYIKKIYNFQVKIAMALSVPYSADFPSFLSKEHGLLVVLC